MAGGTGTIDLKVSPSNALVEIDGKQVKARTFSAKAGDHTLTIRANGYATKKQKVRVIAKKTTKITIRLSKTGSKKKTTTVVRRPSKKGAVIIGRKTTVKKPLRPIKGKKTIGGKKTPARKPIVRKPVRKPVKKTVKTKTVKTKTKKGTRTKTKTVKSNTRTVNRRPARRTTGTRRPAARGNVSGARRGGRGGSTSYRPWAILSFVVGGAALTGGYIVNGMAQDHADEFNASRNRTEKLSLQKKAQDTELASNVLYGVGATGVALGVLLLAIDPGDRRATVAPLPGGGAMVGYTGSF
jgi:hypothetical protein